MLCLAFVSNLERSVCNENNFQFLSFKTAKSECFTNVLYSSQIAYHHIIGFNQERGRGRKRSGRIRWNGKLRQPDPNCAIAVCQAIVRGSEVATLQLPFVVWLPSSLLHELAHTIVRMNANLRLHNVTWHRQQFKSFYIRWKEEKTKTRILIKVL